MEPSEATLTYDAQTVSLPVVESTTGDRAIDISNLRSATGMTTLDKGYANTAETLSAVTHLDGEEGILRHRGYPIEQLVEHSSFLEVAYLLYHGELPTADELETWVGDIQRHTLIREDMRHLFEAFPTGAHPMQMVASAISALASYYSDALDPLDPDAGDISTRRLLAKLPTITAWAYKYRISQAYVYPRSDLEYTSNFLHMMFALPVEEYKVNPALAKALDVLFILHADHSQNLSTSAVRLVGSGQANVFSAIASGIHALSGPLHGGANQSVLEMLGAMIRDGGDTKKYIARAKDKDDPFRLMGFGHRVYKNFDPRARLIKGYAQEVLDELSLDDPLLEMALELEQVALEDDYFAERKLYPNVDFYSGIVYRAMGFPVEMFTVLFAIGRLPGWLAQWREMVTSGDMRIQRPRQVYTGVPLRDYVPMSER